MGTFSVSMLWLWLKPCQSQSWSKVVVKGWGVGCRTLKGLGAGYASDTAQVWGCRPEHSHMMI